MECYCDADLAGMRATEDCTNQESVRSRTGFVICIYGCPIVWKSQLMVPIACSTMQSEYSALSLAMKDVIPLQELFKTVGGSVGILDKHLASFKTKVCKDNQGAQKLAKLHPGQIKLKKVMSVRSKYLTSNRAQWEDRKDVIQCRMNRS